MLFSLEIMMTKDRVAVGKIESWLQEFESCSPKVRQKITWVLTISSDPRPQSSDYGF